MSGSILTAQQELINRLRDEVNRSESGIQQEIERQTDDLGVMRKRMKEHTSSTRDAHHDQLRHIDVSNASIGLNHRCIITNCLFSLQERFECGLLQFALRPF